EGRAFGVQSLEHTGIRIDPCAAQPVTELARSVNHIGPGAVDQATASGVGRPHWERLFEYGMALVGGLQEQAHEALPILERAIALTPVERRDARGMLLAQLARLAARETRVDDALRWADAAEGELGPHPALDRMRGDALASVWRWEEAAAAYGRLSERAPEDYSAWESLTRALGSLGRDDEALQAASTGLALRPTSEDLLRSQALASRHLAIGNHASLHQAFLTYRHPDNTL